MFNRIEIIARNYCRGIEIDFKPPPVCDKVNRDFASKVACAYEDMEHAPDNLTVKLAYSFLAKEIQNQYRFVLSTGLEVEFIKGDNPYKSPWASIADIKVNNHLWVNPTSELFGSLVSTYAEESPLLKRSRFVISNQPALINDLFRVIHDYFGHAMLSNGFRASGEETAYQVHKRMFSSHAGKAIATETRGQNCWVNFGPHGENNRKAGAHNTIYADQKTGLLPSWATEVY